LFPWTGAGSPQQLCTIFRVPIKPTT
jgi:hypothetical protein